MKFTIIATGKCKNREIITLTAEYIKRLQPFFPTTLIEVPNAPTSAKEAKNQLAKIPENAFLIALDETGSLFSTQKLAQTVEKWQNAGHAHLVFLIGGAEGLHSTVKTRANATLSLSPLTLPHMLVRPVLAEQLYRVATVLAGHPYHREG